MPLAAGAADAGATGVVHRQVGHAHVNLVDPMVAVGYE